MSFGFEIIGASIFSVLCIVCAGIYSLLNKAYTYWDKKNVKGPRPSYIFGTWKGFSEKFLGNEDRSNAVQFGKVYGTYDGLTPNLAITDPDLIKEVLVSSVENFEDIRVSSESSLVLKDSLLSLSNEEKSEVQILTNSLLNPHKLDKLIPQLESSVENLINNIVKERQEDGKLNITSSVSDFIDDTIALTIFGTELNADVQFKDEFVRHIEQILNVKTPQSIMALLPFLYENYFKDHWILPEKSLQYFTNHIMTGISQSSTSEGTLSKEHPTNLIELMVQAAEEEKKLLKKDKEEGTDEAVLKDNIIISKCIASMLTLANATRTTVLLGIYSLADNEEVQQKLFKEVEENKSNKLSYENVQNLDYLDQVVKEVLRLYPFEFRLERVCKKDAKIGEIDLNEKVRVSIPLYALHRSEDFYPEPEKFDPERFSRSASEKRNPFTYLPFGQAGNNGSDISLQLGILASKVALIRLVQKLKFNGVQQSGLHSLFKKGFTRIPLPEPIEIKAEDRN